MAGIDVCSHACASGCQRHEARAAYAAGQWLHVLIPGNLRGDVFNCDWLLYIWPLRVACRDCWSMLVFDWFLLWMRKREAICFKTADAKDLKYLFWCFKWSYTQRCLFRYLQDETSAVVAGSYGAAWHLNRCGQQTWVPNDIDI